MQINVKISDWLGVWAYLFRVCNNFVKFEDNHKTSISVANSWQRFRLVAYEYVSQVF
jgi:hypothetical protein